MTQITYNMSLLFGLLMIGGGVSFWSIPAAMVTVGGIVIVLTFVSLWLASRGKGV